MKNDLSDKDKEMLSKVEQYGMVSLKETSYSEAQSLRKLARLGYVEGFSNGKFTMFKAIK